MSKVKVYNLEGKNIEEITLNPDIFDIDLNEDLVFQAIRVQEFNARKPIAHTKTRGEVRGGGRKPWKQKGTGRARAGSRRSPIWIGGGITFGPRSDRNFSLKLNKKMKKKALFMTLTDKLKEGNLMIVDSLKTENIKTKEIVKAVKKLKLDDKSVLFTTSEKNVNFEKSSNNIQKVDALTANSLNILDIVKNQILVLEKGALEVIENTFNKQ